MVESLRSLLYRGVRVWFCALVFAKEKVGLVRERGGGSHALVQLYYLQSNNRASGFAADTLNCLVFRLSHLINSWSKRTRNLAVSLHPPPTGRQAELMMDEPRVVPRRRQKNKSHSLVRHC